MLHKPPVQFALLVFSLCVAGAVGAQPLPVLDYVNHADFDSARLSPDGAHIAMVSPQDDREMLAILDTATLQVKATFQTQRNNGVLSYWWANEERIVFATSINRGDQVGMTGDLYAFNVDNTQKFHLGGPSGREAEVYQVMDTLEKDRDNIMVVRWPIRRGSIARSHPEALLMDIYQPPPSGSGGRTAVGRTTDGVQSPLPWGQIYTDNDGQVRIAYATNDDGKIDVQLRDNAAWRDVSAFLGGQAEEGVTQLGQPIGFNRANTGVYYLARGPQGTIGISLFDIASNTSTLLYAHEKYDVTSGDLVIAPDGKDLIGVTVMGAAPETHYFGDHPDEGIFRSIEKSLPGYRVNFLNFTEDERKGLAMVSSSTVAPALFLLDRDAGTFSPLYSSRPRLQGAPMTPAESVSLTARDGTPLEGYLTRAAGVEGPAPLVVLVHGGPHGIRDNPTFNPEVKLLASRGYSVLQVNFRGSGGYGLAFQNLGYRNWGTTMIDDIADATRHVAEQGLVVSDRICVMGGSYGGYGAMMALARYPELYKCGVGISGVYDLNLMRKSDVPFLPGGEAYLEQILGTDEDELRANSPVTLAANIKGAVFLAHGGEDKRVRPVNAERFKDALDDADIPYEWFFVRTAGHGFALPENREKLYTQLLAFLEKNL
jgi:dipeptidyl aminopeptidase/acylaminoacyl peptidase